MADGGVLRYDHRRQEGIIRRRRHLFGLGRVLSAFLGSKAGRDGLGMGIEERDYDVDQSECESREKQNRKVVSGLTIESGRGSSVDRAIDGRWRSGGICVPAAAVYEEGYEGRERGAET